MKNIYESHDKFIVPYLLVQRDIDYLGHRLENNIVYFKFSPYVRCEELVNAFASRRAPLVQPKDLLDAIEFFRDIIFEMKEKRKGL